MSDRFFDVKQETCVDGAYVSWVEKDKILDVNDSKWAYPEIADTWELPAEHLEVCQRLWNPSFSKESKMQIGMGMLEASIKAFEEAEHECEFKKYIVPGCPEEPDTENTVWVLTPPNAKRKKNRVMFHIPGGALVSYCAFNNDIERFALTHNCVVVVPLYRMSFQAEYPAAINDLHAAYKWMMEHTEELKINSDNVLIYGYSSGAHLATAFGFRVKRYGYNPKGIVAIIPQTDDRETVEQSFNTRCWDSIAQRWALKQWLGENFCSVRVGPEALANHATVKDCIGYPPCYIHSAEFDPDRDRNREFYSKLLAARVFTEYHCWGGSKHDSTNWSMEGSYHDIIWAVINHNINSCFEYDLRRPWTVE